MTTPDFTRTAAAMVARNDRRAWVHGLAAVLRRAGARAGLGWSALVLVGFILVVLPANMRMA